MADPFADEPSEDVPAPPKKKSLFGNPAWSKSKEPDEGVDFFSRAKELYPMRVAEEERKRQKKLAKQVQERKASSSSAERRVSSSPGAKRRRVSAQPQDGEGNSSPNSPNNALQDDLFSRGEALLAPPKKLSSPTAPSPRRKIPNRKLGGSSKAKSIPKGIIALSDDDDAGGSIQSAKRAAPQPISLDSDDEEVYAVLPKIYPPEEEDPVMSDEEFPELVQRAREREREKELERLKAARAFAESNQPDRGVRPAGDVFEEPNPAESDRVIDILVTSCIEGTKPLVVRRRLNQRLKEVRLSWCDKQTLHNTPFPPHLVASIFLTWNGKRLFDASTCKHLGMNVGKDGNFSSEGEGFDAQGRLHFEAWTEDLFRAYQNQPQSYQQGDQQEESQPKEEVAERIKLLLMAKDMESFRMKVKASTTVEKIAHAFRLDKKIPAEKKVSLFFDGDELDPALRVRETELADMDTVEVHIR